MQLDTTSATTLTALREPAREDATSARGPLGQFWEWGMGYIARYRARHQLLPLDEHMLRDIGFTRADAPRSIESQNSSRMCAGAWGWYIGTVTGGSARACDFL